MGNYTKPVFYSQVIDSNGRIILDNTTPDSYQVLKPSTATLLTQGMTSVITEGTGTSCKLDNDMPVSGKTGTTSSNYDLWFCGYTPYLTASIWTGYDENTTLSGDQAYHEVLWAKIMNKINKVKKYKKKKFELSDDVKKYNICSSSGKVAIKGVCPSTYSEYYLKGTQPDKCSYHSGYSSKTTDTGSGTTSDTTTKNKETTSAAKKKTSETTNSEQ
jgi:penicillin-binding protein 1A